MKSKKPGALERAASLPPRTSATSPARAGTSPVDLDTVRELARIAGEFDLAEVEADPSGHIRIRRMVEAAPPAPSHRAVGTTPLSLAPPIGSPAASGSAAPDDGGLYITSPFVGTFYRAASPEAAPFVDVGQAVKKGQVVCIVEAMKLMNEIEAEADGKIAEILVKNGEHVEYGQKLFRIAR